MADESTPKARPDGTVQSDAQLAARIAEQADRARLERRAEAAMAAHDAGIVTTEDFESKAMVGGSMGGIGSTSSIASATKGINLGMSESRPQTRPYDEQLSRVAALEVAEAHVQQLEAKYEMSLPQRTTYVLAYADWLCGGPVPKDLS